MIRRLYIIILILLASINAYAHRHWFGASPMAFTTLSLDNSPLTTPKIGAGGGLGFNYLFQKRNFLLQVGLEGTYNNHRVAIKDNSLEFFPMIDNQLDTFTYHGLVEHRIDGSNNFALRLPLMMGAEYEYFYFLAGAKLHLNFKGKSKSQATLTTWGDYLKFIDDVYDVDPIFFTDRPIETRHKVQFGLDVRPSIEVGAVFYGTQWIEKIHLGLYAEYGLLNTLPRQRNDKLMDIRFSESMQVEMNHIYNTSHSTSLHHLAVGLRLTMFLEYISYDKCRCVYDFVYD
jgi:hypothetical protein